MRDLISRAVTSVTGPVRQAISGIQTFINRAISATVGAVMGAIGRVTNAILAFVNGALNALHALHKSIAATGWTLRPSAAAGLSATSDGSDTADAGGSYGTDTPGKCLIWPTSARA